MVCSELQVGEPNDHYNKRRKRVILQAPLYKKNTVLSIVAKNNGEEE